MFLVSLSLSHFRNYASLEFSCPPGLSVICGKNAQGKSNLLEAIYYVSTGRSFRTAKLQELVRWGQERFAVRAEFESSGVTHRLEAGAGAGQSKYLLDGRPGRGHDLFGRFKAVIFASEDMDVIRQEPAVRRRFFDLFFGQLETDYAKHLEDYTRVIKSRNLLLKQERFEELEPWDELLIRDGAWLMARRTALLREFETTAAGHHREVSSGDESLTLAYKSSVEGAAEEDFMRGLRDKIAEHREHERILQSTLCGPHRDDYEIQINGASARVFGSEGQKRSVMLSMRMAQWKFLQKRCGERPMLLLDDVLGELDSGRQMAFLQGIAATGAQAFLALTDANEIAREKDWPVFHVQAGTLMPPVAMR